MGSYKELSVYEKSYQAARAIYLLANSFPKDEQFGLISQIKRAATSIPLNIAEGYGKGAGYAEVLRFLKMAKGSVAEMEVLLRFSKDFGYINEIVFEEQNTQYEEIGRMLSGLMRNLQERQTSS